MLGNCSVYKAGNKIKNFTSKIRAGPKEQKITRESAIGGLVLTLHPTCLLDDSHYLNLKSLMWRGAKLWRSGKEENLGEAVNNLEKDNVGPGKGLDQTSLALNDLQVSDSKQV